MVVFTFPRKELYSSYKFQKQIEIEAIKKKDKSLPFASLSFKRSLLKRNPFSCLVFPAAYQIETIKLRLTASKVTYFHVTFLNHK